MTYMTRWQKFVWRVRRKLVHWLERTPYCDMPSRCLWEDKGFSEIKEIFSSEANYIMILPSVGVVCWDRRSFPLRHLPRFDFQTPDGNLTVSLSGKFNEPSEAQ